VSMGIPMGIMGILWAFPRFFFCGYGMGMGIEIQFPRQPCQKVKGIGLARGGRGGNAPYVPQNTFLTKMRLIFLFFSHNSARGGGLQRPFRGQECPQEEAPPRQISGYAYGQR